jgi:hypothetical protein
MINLTMPLGTWLGLSQSPGQVAGFGLLGAEDSRDLGQAMGAHPRTRWCVTITDHTGRPLAHGCIPRRRGPPRPSPGPPWPKATTGPGPATNITAWTVGFPLQWLEAGQCTHRRESASYRPPPGLQHLIRIRQDTCAFPGCGRAARRCDLDHTLAYHRGGRTCECNLAPLCRKHHHTKQSHGWTLNQPEPGVMTWTTPTGRRYTTSP